MSDERVEEIRRRAEDIINEWLDRDYAVAARPVPTKRERERLVDRIAAALAQAERERDEARAERNARARDVMHLEAEVERLKEYVGEPGGPPYNELVTENDRLAADLARVRAALEKIAEVDHIGRDHAFDACCEIARAALEGRVNNPHMNSSEDK